MIVEMMSRVKLSRYFFHIDTVISSPILRKAEDNRPTSSTQLDKFSGGVHLHSSHGLSSGHYLQETNEVSPTLHIPMFVVFLQAS